MLKLKIFSVGKTKEEWLESAITEYIKRLQKTLHVECIWAKNDAHLLELVEKEALVIYCDAEGKQFTSEEFSGFLVKKFIEGGSRLSIVIGGAEGLPLAIKKSKELLSFSKMTMTHQMIRLFLLEQVYRAFEIQKGSSYHK